MIKHHMLAATKSQRGRSQVTGNVQPDATITAETSFSHSIMTVSKSNYR